MTNEFIPYIEALALKELGFDEPCFGTWFTEGRLWIHEQDMIDGSAFSLHQAPLYQQAFRWFRDKYGLKHDIDDDNIGSKFYFRIKSFTDKFDNYDDILLLIRQEKDWVKIEFKTYEEAEFACLRKLIEIVKSKKDEIK